MSAMRDILVIDDEPMVAQAVVKVCGAEGMTVTAADHASEALRVWRRGKVSSGAVRHHDARPRRFPVP